MQRFFESSRVWRALLLMAVASASCACSSDAKKNDDACTPDDADGIISEPAEFVVTVSDTEFAPKILAAQNSSTITLTLRNQGTTPHSWVIDCRPTPNEDGCPLEACFPSDARIAPVAPGESARVVFETPLVEGLYDFHSDVAEDRELEPGQFIVQ